MVDFVIRHLSEQEAKEMRISKLKLEETTWKAFFIRIFNEWRDINEQHKKSN